MGRWWSEKQLPQTPLEQYEAAKQRVANMLDMGEWKWLKARIADEHLSWVAIMELIAKHV